MSPTTTLALRAGLAVTLSSAATLAAAAAQPQSSATGVTAQFESSGLATTLDPIGEAVGQASGAYNTTVNVATASSIVAVAPQLPPPSLFVTAKGVTSHATSSGIQIDNLSSEADTALAAVDLSFNLSPPPPGPSPQPFLQVSARGITANATSSLTFPVFGFVNGAASIGSLTIGGQLVGGATVRYSGAIPPNTVIYKSPTVKITLNRQIKTVKVSCSEVCVVWPTKLDVAAIDISLHDAVMNGAPVSGDILVGEATAR